MDKFNINKKKKRKINSLKIIKKKKNKKIKSKKRNINKSIIIKIIVSLLLTIIYLCINKVNNKNNKTIIESINYEGFNIMKNKYQNEYSSILDKVNIISYIRSYNIKRLKKNKNNINIVVSLNSRYTYILLVSMNTVLYNCDKDKSFITYHILCTPDVTSDNITNLKSFMNDYSNNLEMIFYNMTTLAINRTTKRLSQATFYRIYSPIFINSDRIIYLDGDVLAFGDLSEMYNLDFNNNYVLGFLDFFSGGVDYLGIHSERFINAGVILLNLKQIREDGIINKLIDGINNSKLILHQDDQTLISYILYPKINRLPFKYCIFNFDEKSDFGIYLSKIRTKINEKEIEEGFNNPIIIHHCLCEPKIWYPNPQFNKDFTNCRKRGNCSCIKYYNSWHFWAKKTKFYKEIIEYLEINKDIS